MGSSTGFAWAENHGSSSDDASASVPSSSVVARSSSDEGPPLRLLPLQALEDCQSGGEVEVQEPESAVLRQNTGYLEGQ